MMAAAVPVAMAAGSAIGSYMGQSSANDVNQHMANKQMDFQREMNAANNAFAERMSNTQWQRTIADMRAAGVNPMLSFTRGPNSSPSGSGTPGGASATVQNPFSNLGSSVHTAMQAMFLKNQLENQELSNKKLGAEIEAVHQNAATAKDLAALYKVNTVNNALTTPALQNQAAMQSTVMGKYLPYVKASTDVIGDVIGAAVPVARIWQGAKALFTHTPKGTIYNTRSGEVSY